MAFEYSHNFEAGVIKCDLEKPGCHNEILLHGNVESIFEQAKIIGWGSKKDSQDEWVNICPGCAE